MYKEFVLINFVLFLVCCMNYSIIASFDSNQIVFGEVLCVDYNSSSKVYSAVLECEGFGIYYLDTYKYIWVGECVRCYAKDGVIVGTEYNVPFQIWEIILAEVLLNLFCLGTLLFKE